MMLQINIFCLLGPAISNHNHSEIAKLFSTISNVFNSNHHLYKKSVVCSNYICHNCCPSIVVHPQDESDIAACIDISTMHSIPVSVKGGGHSYTCQSVKSDGVLIDMINFKHITINQNDPIRQFITIGTGLVWHEVLAFLEHRDLTAVHGQCTSVGVAGFSLHGGVHFGGLSKLYGLSADNILGMTVIVANGSIIVMNSSYDDLTNVNCAIKCRRGIPSSSFNDLQYTKSKSCDDLWFAMRGTGSSFGIVTSLTIKVYNISNNQIKSAMSVLSLNITNTQSKKWLTNYLTSIIPNDITFTLYGLDKYFKAYFLLLQFAKDVKQSIAYEPMAVFDLFEKDYVHFALEISWLSDDNDILEVMNDIHNSIKSISKSMVKVRPWLETTQMWSVPSYGVVWGAGHSFGGASVTVGPNNSAPVLYAALDQYAEYKQNAPCADCVFVIHRVGRGVKWSEDDHSTSVHPSLRRATLWLEVDCGHFYRLKQSWPICQKFLDVTQQALDVVTETHEDERCHYPNVPNLKTKHWRTQYFGDKNYMRLLEIKREIDPMNVFNHQQSVVPSNSPESIESKDINHLCQAIYDYEATSNQRLVLYLFLVGVSGIVFLYIRKNQ